MIQISKEDAQFIFNELNERAKHQINAYGMPDANLMLVLADLADQLDPPVAESEPAATEVVESEPVAEAPQVDDAPTEAHQDVTPEA